MHTVIGFRVPVELKKLLQRLATKENRTLTSFVLNAVLYYVQQVYGIDWHKVKDKPEK